LVEIRDETIAELDAALDGKYERGARWAGAGAGAGANPAAVRMVIADAVDLTLLKLLRAVDNAEFDIRWRADEESEFVDPTEGGFGECEGWYSGVSGWLEQFATQRTYLM
jgi:hypothetical protein